MFTLNMKPESEQSSDFQGQLTMSSSMSLAERVQSLAAAGSTTGFTESNIREQELFKQ